MAVDDMKGMLWLFPSSIDNTCTILKYDPAFPPVPPLARSLHEGRAAAGGEEVSKVMRTMRCRHCGADYYGGRCQFCGSDEFVDVEEHYNSENMTLYGSERTSGGYVSTRTAGLRVF